MHHMDPPHNPATQPDTMLAQQCQCAAMHAQSLRPQPQGLSARCAPRRAGRLHQIHAAVGKEHGSSSQETASTSAPDISQELNKSIRQTASTFAPRSSTAKGKNPAVKGSVLYNVFEVQAWLTLVAGGLLSFNLIFPSDEPDIARLMGMWSIWMFTIPSLRAKECTPREKDALNILFVAIPLLNVLLPFIYKSFPFVWAADVLMVGGVYWWKGIWQEVYGVPLMMEGALNTPVPGAEAAAAAAEEQKESS